MKAEAARLYEQLRSHYRERGLLPIPRADDTPADQARSVAARTGDARFEQFIFEYYYPALYAPGPGPMSEAAARKLVEEIVARSPAPAPVKPYPAAAAAAPPAPLAPRSASVCRGCGQNLSADAALDLSE